MHMQVVCVNVCVNVYEMEYVCGCRAICGPYHCIGAPIEAIYSLTDQSQRATGWCVGSTGVQGGGGGGGGVERVIMDAWPGIEPRMGCFGCQCVW